jgi:hypothetical protein
MQSALEAEHYGSKKAITFLMMPELYSIGITIVIYLPTRAASAAVRQASVAAFASCCAAVRGAAAVVT